MASTTGLALIDCASAFGGRTAIADADGAHDYATLLSASASCSAALTGSAGALEGERIAFLVEAGFDWVVTLWAIWRKGGVAVPLCAAHPEPEMDYVVADTGAKVIIGDETHADVLRRIAHRNGALFLSNESPVRRADDRTTQVDRGAGTGPSRSTALAAAARIAPDHAALILFTSGTTSRPKGVVLTPGNLAAQTDTLVSAWEWTESDRILHVLPLHHTHGIVNALLCALRAGASCEMMRAFDAGAAWHRFASGDITLFMAVPTIYVKLIAWWDAASSDERARTGDACARLRLMVSGSAALPVSVLERWRALTGHTLLERYGMTEIGMALSNPLHGERRAGSVGFPLPGVECRLLDEHGNDIDGDGVSGEIHVRGPNVFRRYWQRPDATREAFRDGWFRTGDIAVIDDGYWRILGRSSVDIIKTGGYKVSALEIEEALRTSADVADCAVVGIEDGEWGERVCAAVQLAADVDADGVTQARLSAWLTDRIAPYKLPRAWRFIDGLPRNAMGKVTKPAVKRLFAHTPPGEVP
jgi:malonyl-CoA/methylmalonyl-CoA synthetase